MYTGRYQYETTAETAATVVCCCWWWWWWCSLGRCTWKFAHLVLIAGLRSNVRCTSHRCRLYTHSLDRLVGPSLLREHIIYTVGHKETCHFILDHNSTRFFVDFYISYLNEREMNALQMSHKIYNFTLYVSLLCLIEPKPHKTANFELWSQLSQYFITRQQEWVHELSELF